MSDEHPKPIHIPDLTNWKKNKITISLGTIAAILVGLYFLHQFTEYHVIQRLDDVFMSEVQASELIDQLEETTQAATAALNKANENSETLVSYIRRQLISEARSELRAIESILQETLLWESANGENQISRDRKRDLESDISLLEERIDCLMEAGDVDECDDD